ncbi:MAG: nucleotidyltransferase family protein [Cyanobacteria bacterium P01_F01_bin.143]
MKRDEILAIVRANQRSLQKLGVKSLSLFGSGARNQIKPDSDIDFLVEFDSPVGLFGLFQVQHYLEDILEHSVDLGTLKALREHLRKPILEEAIRVF